ncbi:2-hydroxyacylsphingosine 1-beta-galactosyltransferase [Trichoplax sp. H2]|nr:2-hydroxyacylsphingosine 1-beta-galactosyltransferase [Trichoplax sp. H2]|eukprot:RDD40055.1 2-hydroxyacylsphingosine 1-beta-galactosyltransferase [Trichoplax sp. H2]
MTSVCKPLIHLCNIFAIALIFSSIQPANSAKVVIIPFSYYTHTFSFIQITHQLLKQGHDVTFVISSAVKFQHGELNTVDSTQFHFHSFKSQLIEDDFNRCRLAVKGNSYVAPCLDEAYKEADAILSDEKARHLVQESDLLICEFSFFGCNLLSRVSNASRQIDINLAGFLDPGPTAYYKVPNPIAYVPQHGADIGTTNMTILQRLQNFWVYWAAKVYFMIDTIPRTYRITRKHFQNGFPDLSPKASLYLLATDFSIDYARPYTPFVKLIGPVFVTSLNAGTVKEKETPIIQDTDLGFILVSFDFDGYLQEIIDRNTLRDIINTFSKLPYKFIWHYNGPSLSLVPTNVYITSQLPWNLVSHSKIKAFITNCKIIDVHQASYHGVPIIGLPITNENFYLAHRMEHVNKGKFTPMQFVNGTWLYYAIQQVIEDEYIIDNSRQIASILHHRPNNLSSVEEVGYWVDYVLNHGTKHLKPEEFNMFWIIAGSYDMYIIVLGILYMIWRIVKSLLFSCCTAVFGKKIKTD